MLLGPQVRFMKAQFEQKLATKRDSFRCDQYARLWNDEWCKSIRTSRKIDEVITIQLEVAKWKINKTLKPSWV